MMTKNKDFFVLRLNSQLYDEGSVRQAFDELKKNVCAEMEEGEYFVVKIKVEEGSEETGYEFLNYVLKLMKNKGVV